MHHPFFDGFVAKISDEDGDAYTVVSLHGHLLMYVGKIKWIGIDRNLVSQLLKIIEEQEELQRPLWLDK